MGLWLLASGLWQPHQKGSPSLCMELPVASSKEPVATEQLNNLTTKNYIQ